MVSGPPSQAFSVIVGASQTKGGSFVATIRTASVLTLSALSLILLDSTAVAQDTGDGALLDEVTVTAQRREQNIQETPVSITARW